LNQPGITLGQLESLAETLRRQQPKTFVYSAAASRGIAGTRSPAVPGLGTTERSDLAGGDEPLACTRSGNSKDSAQCAKLQIARLAIGNGGASEAITLTDPAAIERLEQLDDAVYDVINGDADRLSVVKELWEQISTQLADPAAAAAREQYLRY